MHCLAKEPAAQVETVRDACRKRLHATGRAAGLHTGRTLRCELRQLHVLSRSCTAHQRKQLRWFQQHLGHQRQWA